MRERISHWNEWSGGIPQKHSTKFGTEDRSGSYIHSESYFPGSVPNGLRELVPHTSLFHDCIHSSFQGVHMSIHQTNNMYKLQE